MELGLTPDTRRAEDTATVVAGAAAAGFDAVGLVAGRAEGARGLLDRAGLRCHELLGLQVTRDLPAAEATVALLADEAARSGAEWVLTTFPAPVDAEVLAATARWAARIEEAGARLAVEFSPLGTVASVADALALREALGPAHLGVVVDVWNFCLGPSTWEDLDQLPLDAVAYVQFTDALAPRDGGAAVTLDEAMTRRALPGDGVLELDRFVAALRGRGWDGTVSLQVLSDELRALPFDEYARLVAAAGRRYWG